jgi:hypothetical protein
MLMVETELRQSAIHGTGVFLVEPVRKGELIWRFDSRIDRIYSEDEIAGLPSGPSASCEPIRPGTSRPSSGSCAATTAAISTIRTDPNTLSLGTGFGDDVAVEDLPAGVELTTDYALICDRVRMNGATYLSAEPPLRPSRTGARAPPPRHSPRRSGARRCRAGSERPG